MVLPSFSHFFFSSSMRTTRNLDHFSQWSCKERIWNTSQWSVGLSLSDVLGNREGGALSPAHCKPPSTPSLLTVTSFLPIPAHCKPPSSSSLPSCMSSKSALASLLCGTQSTERYQLQQKVYSTQQSTKDTEPYQHISPSPVTCDFQIQSPNKPQGLPALFLSP